MRSEISPEPALLGFLRSAPVHGYDLHKQVTEQLGPVWHLGLSQMYAILKDYETRGWVRTRLERQSTRPSRKVLELTPAGRKAFAAWMAQPARGLREFRVDFFARLYFARAGGSRKLERLIDDQIAEIRAELERLTVERPVPPLNGDEFRLAVRDFRIEQLNSALHWLETRREAW